MSSAIVAAMIKGGEIFMEIFAWVGWTVTVFATTIIFLGVYWSVRHLKKMLADHPSGKSYAVTRAYSTSLFKAGLGLGVVVLFLVSGLFTVLLPEGALHGSVEYMVLLLIMSWVIIPITTFLAISNLWPAVNAFRALPEH